MHLLVGGFRPRYGSVEHETGSLHLDHSATPAFDPDGTASASGLGLASAAPRAIFDEDQEQQLPHHEPPPMHRSKSSLGAQSRGTLFLICTCFFLNSSLALSFLSPFCGLGLQVLESTFLSPFLYSRGAFPPPFR